MRRPAILGLWGLVFALVITTACRQATPPNAETQEGWRPVPLAFADRFAMAQRGREIALVVWGDGGRGDTLGRFHLAPPGAHGADPFHSRGVRFTVPIQRAALLSTTHLPFAEQLVGLEGVIAAALPATPSTRITRRVAEGRLMPLAPGESGRREQRVAYAADAVFDHPFGHAAGARHEPEWIPVCEYLEEHPLGRAEWLRFFGAFFDEHQRADSLFRAIAERYINTRSYVAGVARRPSVFFGSAWQGTWSVPPGNSLMGTLLADAGADHLHAGTTASGNIDLHVEQVLHAASIADHWGMVVDVPGPERIDRLPGMDGRLLAMPALAPGRVFIVNTRSTDFFGQAILEPDVLLMDLVGVFHPDQVPAHRPRYFHVLDQ